MLLEQLKELDAEIRELRIDSVNQSQLILDTEFSTIECEDYLVLNKTDKKSFLALNLKEPKQKLKEINSELKSLEDARSTIKKQWYWMNKKPVPTALSWMKF